MRKSTNVIQDNITTIPVKQASTKKIMANKKNKVKDVIENKITELNIGMKIPKTKFTIVGIGEKFVVGDIELQKLEVSLGVKQNNVATFLIDKKTFQLYSLTDIGEKYKLGNDEIQQVFNFEQKFFINPNSFEIIRVKQEKDTMDKIGYKYRIGSNAIIQIGEKYTIGGQEIQKVLTNNEKWIWINPQTLEKVELKVSGTDHVITDFFNKYKIGGQEIQVALINNTHTGILINPQTLEKVELKVSWTENKITYVSEEYLIGNQKLRYVGFGNKEWVWADSETLEKVELKVSGTDDEISYIGHRYKIGGQEIQDVLINDKEGKGQKGILINPKTLEKVELKVSGTDDIIEGINGVETIIGNKKVQSVKINNGHYIWVNPQTLEKIELKVNGTGENIIYIRGEYTIGGKKVLKVAPNMDLFIDPETFEPIKVKGTNDIIIDVMPEFTVGDKKLQFARIGYNEGWHINKWVLIDPETLEKKSVKGIDDVTMKIDTRNSKNINTDVIQFGGKYIIGGRIIQGVVIDTKIYDYQWHIFINTETFEVVRVKGIGIITQIRDIYKLGKQEVQEVYVGDYRVIINTKTLEPLEIKFGKRDSMTVTRILDEYDIGGKKVRQVEVNGSYTILINPETLEEIKGTKKK